MCGSVNFKWSAFSAGELIDFFIVPRRVGHVFMKQKEITENFTCQQLRFRFVRMCVTDYIQCNKSMIPLFYSSNQSARRQTEMPVYGWLSKYLISLVSASSMFFFNVHVSLFPQKYCCLLSGELQIVRFRRRLHCGVNVSSCGLIFRKLLNLPWQCLKVFEQISMWHECQCWKWPLLCRHRF